MTGNVQVPGRTITHSTPWTIESQRQIRNDTIRGQQCHHDGHILAHINISNPGRAESLSASLNRTDPPNKLIVRTVEGVDA